MHESYVCTTERLKVLLSLKMTSKTDNPDVLFSLKMTSKTDNPDMELTRV